MLTEREKKWLSNRPDYQREDAYTDWYGERYAKTDVWRDLLYAGRDVFGRVARITREAGEFEALVAAKLADKNFEGNADFRCSRCVSKYKGAVCKHSTTACRLMHARLKVEDEVSVIRSCHEKSNAGLRSQTGTGEVPVLCLAED